MWIQILVGLALVVGAILAFASTKPDSFRVERSIRVGASPSKVFAFIDDFHRWVSWSPWEKIDPAMKRTYGETPAGKGATYAWEGNKKVGSGRMEILESSPTSKVVIKLDFFAPFEAHNTAEFRIVPDGDGATVTWAMHGPAVFANKVMSVFVSMDALIGKDFEAGLSNLKVAAES